MGYVICPFWQCELKFTSHIIILLPQKHILERQKTTSRTFFLSSLSLCSMCTTMQRKRFFSSSSDSEMSLPTTQPYLTSSDDRLKPQRSHSLGDGLFSLRSSRRASRRHSQPTTWQETSLLNDDYLVYHRDKDRSRHTHGLTLASVIGCLVLAMLGAVLFQREANLDIMLEVKHEIINHLHQLQELRGISAYAGQGGFGTASAMFGELDADKQLYLLEQRRLQTRQNIQLLSKRLLKEK